MKLLTILLLLISFHAQGSCRSAATVRAFKHEQACPSTGKHSGPCPGYVADHVCGLAVGGKDIPLNLQWQTISEGHKKDRIELTPIGVIKFCNATNSTPTRQVFNCK